MHILWPYLIVIVDADLRTVKPQISPPAPWFDAATVGELQAY